MREDLTRGGAESDYVPTRCADQTVAAIGQFGLLECVREAAERASSDG